MTAPQLPATVLFPSSDSPNVFRASTPILKSQLPKAPPVQSDGMANSSSCDPPADSGDVFGSTVSRGGDSTDPELVVNTTRVSVPAVSVSAEPWLYART